MNAYYFRERNRKKTVTFLSANYAPINTLVVTVYVWFGPRLSIQPFVHPFMLNFWCF